MIGVESMVTRTGLRYTRDYLTPGICSLIKPAAMEKLISFRAKIHTVMLESVTNNYIIQSIFIWSDGLVSMNTITVHIYDFIV